jgi:hypothetical protein
MQRLIPTTKDGDENIRFSIRGSYDGRKSFNTIFMNTVAMRTTKKDGQKAASLCILLSVDISPEVDAPTLQRDRFSPP